MITGGIPLVLLHMSGFVVVLQRARHREPGQVRTLYPGKSAPVGASASIVSSHNT